MSSVDEAVLRQIEQILDQLYNSNNNKIQQNAEQWLKSFQHDTRSWLYPSALLECSVCINSLNIDLCSFSFILFRFK